MVHGDDQARAKMSYKINAFVKGHGQNVLAAANFLREIKFVSINFSVDSERRYKNNFRCFC